VFVSNNLLSIKTGFISVKKKDNPLAGMSEPISSDFVWGLVVLEFDEGENSLFGGLRFDVRVSLYYNFYLFYPFFFLLRTLYANASTCLLSR